MNFIQFRPFSTSSLRFLPSLTVMSKSKKTLEMSLDFTPSFKTSADRSWVLFRMWIISKIAAIILFKINMAEKESCRAYVLFSVL